MKSVEDSKGKLVEGELLILASFLLLYFVKLRMTGGVRGTGGNYK